MQQAQHRVGDLRERTAFGAPGARAHARAPQHAGGSRPPRWRQGQAPRLVRAHARPGRPRLVTAARTRRLRAQAGRPVPWRPPARGRAPRPRCCKSPHRRRRPPPAPLRQPRRPQRRRPAVGPHEGAPRARAHKAAAARRAAPTRVLLLQQQLLGRPIEAASAASAGHTCYRPDPPRDGGRHQRVLPEPAAPISGRARSGPQAQRRAAGGAEGRGGRVAAL